MRARERMRDGFRLSNDGWRSSKKQFAYTLWQKICSIEFFSTCCSCLLILLLFCLSFTLFLSLPPISPRRLSFPCLHLFLCLLCNFTSISCFVRLARDRRWQDEFLSKEPRRLCLGEQCCRTGDWQEAGKTVPSAPVKILSHSLSFFHFLSQPVIQKPPQSWSSEIHINWVSDQVENGLIDKTSVQGQRRTKQAEDCFRLA